MGNFLDDLKAALKSPIAFKQRFRVEYDPTGNDVYAFFESTDDVSFYKKMILTKMAQGARLHTYLCGSKKSVWYGYEFAETENKLKNVLFFVDKDLDDFTGHALPERRQIFVTEYYSIESYICSEAALRAVMEDVIYLPYEDNRYDSITRMFNEGLGYLASQMAPVFAEVILLRRQGTKVQFASFGDALSPCFEMVGMELRAAPNVRDTFSQRCQYAAAVLAAEDIESMTSILISKPIHCWLRGKFALWFFLEFVAALWKAFQGSFINERKKIKKTIDLRPENVFFVLEGKHPAPQGLTEFLSVNIM